MVDTASYLAPTWPVAVLSAGRFKNINCLALLRQTFSSAGLSKRTKTFLHFSIPIRSSAAWKARFDQNFATFVRLSTTRVTSVDEFAKCRSSSDKKPFPSADIKWEVSPGPKRPMTVPLRLQARLCWWKNSKLLNYCHESVLLRVHNINKPEITLHGISGAHILTHVESFHAYGFEYARGKLSVTITAAVGHSEESEEAPLATFCVFGEAAYVVPMDISHRL